MFILQLLILIIGFVITGLEARNAYKIYLAQQRIAHGSIVVAAVVLVLAFGVAGSFGEVPAGYRGVVLRFSATTGEVKQPGLYFITPFIERVVPMNVQVQAYSADAAAASRDLQNVSTKVTLNYSLDSDPQKIVDIYNRLQQDWEDRIIAPAIQEATKADTAQFTAEELITRRPEARDKLEALLRTRMESFDLHIAAMSITNFQFSDEFTKAIEAKVVAFQNYLQSQNVLKQRQVEAEQAIAVARGDAEANRLRRLQISPLTVQYDAVQKWNGVLPVVTGGAIPLLNLGALTPSSNTR
ncbi:MAG: prohibitin family protein [Candidatus Eremiobacteraeota bacterium]|nr:prohibitin family protein [Candidatus Eremiobacteraeota bacterium]